jgi:hypothetical protein
MMGIIASSALACSGAGAEVTASSGERVTALDASVVGDYVREGDGARLELMPGDADDDVVVGTLFSGDYNFNVVARRVGFGSYVGTLDGTHLTNDSNPFGTQGCRLRLQVSFEPAGFGGLVMHVLRNDEIANMCPLPPAPGAAWPDSFFDRN